MATKCAEEGIRYFGQNDGASMSVYGTNVLAFLAMADWLERHAPQPPERDLGLPVPADLVGWMESDER